MVRNRCHRCCAGHVATLVMKIPPPQTGCEDATGTNRGKHFVNWKLP